MTCSKMPQLKARAVSEDIREKTAHLDRAARVEAGLITLRDICALYDISEGTVRNWGLEPIDAPTQMNLYRLEDLADQIENQ